MSEPWDDVDPTVEFDDYDDLDASFDDYEDSYDDDGEDDSDY